MYLPDNITKGDVQSSPAMVARIAKNIIEHFYKEIADTLETVCGLITWSGTTKKNGTLAFPKAEFTASCQHRLLHNK